MTEARCWIPARLGREWVPAASSQGSLVADGFAGFAERSECAAECDARNRAIVEREDAEIERLEGELAAARSRRSKASAALRREHADTTSAL